MKRLSYRICALSAAILTASTCIQPAMSIAINRNVTVDRNSARVTPQRSPNANVIAIPAVKEPMVATRVNPRVGSVDFSSKLSLQKSFNVNLIAATSDKEPNAVLLKWVIDNGWLADSGYNLYRKGPGDTDFKKIAGPIVQNPNPAPISIKGLDGKMRTLNVASMIQQAKLKIQIPQDKLQMFKARTAVESSMPVFEEIRTMKRQQYTPFTGRVRTGLTVNVDSFPRVSTYMKRFQVKSSAANQPTRAQVRSARANRSSARRNIARVTSVAAHSYKLDMSKTSQVDQVMLSRTQLMAASLLSNQVSQALGTGYTDTKVTLGDTYEYQLRGIKPDNTDYNSPSASCTITVGADPRPALPSNLQAVQTNTTSVGLRWNQDTTQSSAKVISYKIYRTVGGKRELLTSQPITVGAGKDSGGSYFDPIFYYVDSQAPVGLMNYQLIGTDAFGRDTAPIGLDFTMADWFTPSPVTAVSGIPSQQGVMLYWTPSRKVINPGPGMLIATSTTVVDSDAYYNVYRADIETPANKTVQTVNGETMTMLKGTMTWEKLNTDPVKPPYITPVSSWANYKPKGAALHTGSRCFVDTTVQKDHYYRYCVLPVYLKNLIEGGGSPTADVPVPDLSVPVPVQNPSAKCNSLVSPKSELSFDDGLVKNAHLAVANAASVKVRNLRIKPEMIGAIPKVHTGGMTTYSATAASISAGSKTHLVRSQISASIAAATLANSDLGSSVVLTWTPSQLTGPVRYRVYRATDSGLLPTSSSYSVESYTPSQTGASNTPKPHTLSVLSAVVGEKATLKSLVSNSVVTLNNKDYSYVGTIPILALGADQYTFLDECAQPTWVDAIPKSRPMHYIYKVTAVNRWGVEGQPTYIQVRIPATMKPPTPTLGFTAPNTEGGVTVAFKPLADKEECDKYLLYRKPVDITGLLGDFKLRMDTINMNLIHGQNGGSSKPSAAMSAFSSGVSSAVNAHSSPTVSKAAVSKLIATMDQSLLGKTRKVGLNPSVNMPVSDSKFTLGLAAIMLTPDYELVGEITPSAVDANGYARYNDMKNLLPGMLYTYTICAHDVDNWKSDASKPQISTVWKVKAPSIPNLTAYANPAHELVVLTWSAPAGDVIGYVVKKAVGDGTVYVQISGVIKETKFIDYSSVRGKKNAYTVYSIDSTGNISDPTNVELVLTKI